MLVILDQRVHALYIVASHCILPLYQFQCPLDASESFETVQSRLVGYAHSVHSHLVWRFVVLRLLNFTCGSSSVDMKYGMEYCIVSGLWL